VLTQTELVFGVGLPALVATLLFLAFRLRPVAARGAGRADASPFALALGFLICQVALLGRPTIPPLDAIEWLSFGLIVLVVLAAICQFVSAARRFYQPLALVVVLLTVCLLARPLVENAWSKTETIAWLAGSGLAAVAMTLLVDRLLRRRAGTVASTGLAITLGATAIVLLLSGTKTYAQLAGAGAVALVPGIALAVLGRFNSCSPRIVPVFVLVLGGLVIAGHWYASLTPPSALLLFVAPLGLWLGELPAVGRWPGWRRGLLALAAVALPLSLAMGLAARKFLEDTAGGY
jgi:hypothetical protein